MKKKITASTNGNAAEAVNVEILLRLSDLCAILIPCLRVLVLDTLSVHLRFVFRIK